MSFIRMQVFRGYHSIRHTPTKHLHGELKSGTTQCTRTKSIWIVELLTAGIWLAYDWTICKSSTYNSTTFDKFFEILVKIVLTTYNK